MVSGRPLLYLSLPGVAFILGVFWFRRRNKNRLENDTTISSGGSGLENELLANNITAVTEELLTKNTTNTAQHTPTKSMNINGSIPNDDEENAANRIFGKSAPIEIIQNGRGTSPVKRTQQQVDSEVLKSKIQVAEHKLLRSIDEDLENLSSPVDLPDSFNNRMSFYSRNVDIKKEKPVVIVATTTPKISPENSFLESKYTKASVQNNNLENDNNQQENVVVNNQKMTTVKADELSKNGAAAAAATAADMANADNDAKTTLENDDTKANMEKRNVDAASPSLSLCSVQSGDSGKGSSLPRSEETQAKMTYEFLLPDSLVGRLYGRRRVNIGRINNKSNANVHLRDTVYVGNLRICAIDGTESEIEVALDLIRQIFPLKRYPNLTMQKIHFALPQSVVPLSTQSLLSLQLNLIEGINNDVVVSATISGNHLFVQHPLHPTHPSLAVLQKCLYESYTDTEAPLLPGIEMNAVCVMNVNGIWYRVQIVDKDDEDTERCVVKFLDFGGYMNVHFNELRQIRTDFMSVPFQATECLLSNVEPIDSCSVECAEVLSRLTKGIVLQAQVVGYNTHNIPEINVYACLGKNNIIFINREIVARKLANWVEIAD